MTEPKTEIDFTKFAVGDTVAIGNSYFGTTTVQMAKIVRETKTLWIVVVEDRDNERRFYKDANKYRKEQIKTNGFRSAPSLFHKDAPAVIEALEIQKLEDLWSTARSAIDKSVNDRHDFERVDIAVDALTAYRDALKGSK